MFFVRRPGSAFPHFIQGLKHRIIQRFIPRRLDAEWPGWFQSLAPRLIEAEKPDAVLDVLSERHLKKTPRWEIP